HGVGMDLEPFDQAGGERTAEFRLARGDPLPYPFGNLDDLGMFAFMAVDRRKVAQLHPGRLALEVMPGVCHESVEATGHFLVRRMQQGIDEKHELLMDTVHLGMLQLVAPGPAEAWGGFGGGRGVAGDGIGAGIGSGIGDGFRIGHVGRFCHAPTRSAASAFPPALSGPARRRSLAGPAVPVPLAGPQCDGVAKVALARAHTLPSASTRAVAKQSLAPALITLGRTSTHWPLRAVLTKSTARLTVTRLGRGSPRTWAQDMPIALSARAASRPPWTKPRELAWAAPARRPIHTESSPRCE